VIKLDGADGQGSDRTILRHVLTRLLIDHHKYAYRRIRLLSATGSEHAELADEEADNEKDMPRTIRSSRRLAVVLGDGKAIRRVNGSTRNARGAG
jgi:hypothetical protein